MPPEIVFLTIAGLGFWIAITGIVMGVWSGMSARRAEHALKSEMLARGMTAEEIVQVIQAQTGKPAKLDLSNATNLRCACEVVVERDEEWQPALVLQVADGAYYIYFVGESMSENQWVNPTRIRFPANSPLNDSAWPSYAFHNGVPRKEPMEAEI